MNKKITIYIIVFIILVISTTISYFNFKKEKYTYPEEYKMDLTHISDTVETEKSGKMVGGHCYLASATMLIKHFDPDIEFWKVYVYQGSAVSFNYYFPNGPNGGASAGPDDSGTVSLLVAASNLGYTPHVRRQIIDRGTPWSSKKIKKLGGDFQTYFFNPPMDEYKQVISSGIPIASSGSPCHADYNVIEGYNEKKLFVIIPNPQDVNRTDPKISCSVGSGLRHLVFWFTPDGKKISDRELMLTMKGTVNESLEIMERYIKNLEEGVNIVNFELERFYSARKFAAIYFKEQGYDELADGYERSADAFYELTSIFPPDANKYKNKIIVQMKKVLEIEKGLLKYWEALN
ncbi:hypothetical protein KKF64_02645 [Patescibacteria group bacterium]|nr:hypothetical protein [Patescibacteria group bacterium]